MKIWIHRDSHTCDHDICEDYTDAVGPDFVEADLPEDFVRAFARAQLAYWQFEDYLERAWDAGKKKEKK